MTEFEKGLLALLVNLAETDVPIFLHSKNAVTAYNLSVPVFNGFMSAVLAPSPTQGGSNVNPNAPTTK